MDRKKFVQDFADRLTQLMRNEGHETGRAGIGIDISKLARVTGCSYQMTRKYVLGRALPELSTVIKIAAWLNISPSWLLFGDDDTQLSRNKTAATIEINADLLKYILNKCTILFSLKSNKDNIVNFIVDAIYDASHINADQKTIHKVIDMMINSATLLNNPAKDSSQLCAS